MSEKTAEQTADEIAARGPDFLREVQDALQRLPGASVSFLAYAPDEARTNLFDGQVSPELVATDENIAVIFSDLVENPISGLEDVSSFLSEEFCDRFATRFSEEIEAAWEDDPEPS